MRRRRKRERAKRRGLGKAVMSDPLNRRGEGKPLQSAAEREAGFTNSSELRARAEGDTAEVAAMSEAVAANRRHGRRDAE
jgi:hypothetical protein